MPTAITAAITVTSALTAQINLPLAVENTSNLGSAIVTSGGTTAPASGTIENWTVSSPVNIPVATTGVSGFRVCDLAQAGNPALAEIMFVMNVSGTTWTVIRGYEYIGSNGTSPVAHAPNFTAIVTTTLASMMNIVNEFDVRSYGAVGDGVTNDQPAIQACINDAATVASSNRKGVVRIPGNRIFGLGSPAGFPNPSGALMIPSNIHLIVEGTLRMLPNANAHMIQLAGVSNITIDGGGTLDGNGPNQSATGSYPTALIAGGTTEIIGGNHWALLAPGPTDVQFSNLRLLNSEFYPWDIGYGTRVHLDSVFVLGCVNSANFVQCTACSAYNCWNEGITADGGFTLYGGNTDCGFVNCYSRNNAGYGFWIYDDSGSTGPNVDSYIVGCTATANVSSGILMQTGAGSIHKNITITGNVLNGNGTAGNTTGEIHANNPMNKVTITGNVIADSLNLFGIAMNGSNWTVQGNTIFNMGIATAVGSGQSCIEAPSGGPYLVTSNIMGDDQTTHTTQYGINFNFGAGYTTPILVADNMFVGTFTTGVLNNAAGRGEGSMIVRNNSGYNPVGSGYVGGLWALPSSTGTWTNNTWVDGTLYCTVAGTVTSVSVNGVVVGTTMAVGNSYRVFAYGSFSVTYSAAPTLVFVGD